MCSTLYTFKQSLTTSQWAARYGCMGVHTPLHTLALCAVPLNGNTKHKVASSNAPPTRHRVNTTSTCRDRGSTHSQKPPRDTERAHGAPLPNIRLCAQHRAPRPRISPIWRCEGALFLSPGCVCRAASRPPHGSSVGQTALVAAEIERQPASSTLRRRRAQPASLTLPRPRRSHGSWCRSATSPPRAQYAAPHSPRAE
jgi:hypothetical protein